MFMNIQTAFVGETWLRFVEVKCWEDLSCGVGHGWALSQTLSNCVTLACPSVTLRPSFFICIMEVIITSIAKLN